MDVDAARLELTSALSVVPPAGATSTMFRAALAVLIDRGIEALCVTPSQRLSFDNLIRIAADAPPTAGRRDFAVLLVHAFGIQGLLPVRGKTEGILLSFLERALLNPLRRAGYPFDGTAYEKRHVLRGLHATIDEHLRPLEPSFPRWIQGVAAPDSD